MQPRNFLWSTPGQFITVSYDFLNLFTCTTLSIVTQNFHRVYFLFESCRDAEPERFKPNGKCNYNLPPKLKVPSAFALLKVTLTSSSRLRKKSSASYLGLQPIRRDRSPRAREFEPR